MSRPHWLRPAGLCRRPFLVNIQLGWSTPSQFLQLNHTPYAAAALLYHTMHSIITGPEKPTTLAVEEVEPDKCRSGLARKLVDVDRCMSLYVLMRPNALQNSRRILHAINKFAVSRRH